MRCNFMNVLWVIGSSLYSLHSLAHERIDVTVIATERAAAVGYLVEGRKAGGLGKSYSGQGPLNKQYFFGYRKSAFSGVDIPCGSLMLNKNTKVKLVTSGGQCSTSVID